MSTTDISFSPSTDQVMQYNQIVETSAIAKGRGRKLKSMSNAQRMRTTNKNHLVLEKGHIPSFSSIEELMRYIQTNSAKSDNEDRSFYQDAHCASQSAQGKGLDPYHTENILPDDI
ncbi:hypothetical protein HAX54_041876, partial [Datura stramonium]|nr:hypothetical protein [Datura stramonium]